MIFSFVDGIGNPIPNAPVFDEKNVSVINGLFSRSLLLDQNFPWEQYTPYVRILVNNELLEPDQPVNANLFAISPFPQGMIAIFENNCPTGWSVFAGLQGKFPVGADGGTFTTGLTGGTTTHSHVLLEDKNKSCSDAPGRVGVSSSGGYLGYFPYGACNFGFYQTKDATTDASNLPPYLTVVFCQKL